MTVDLEVMVWARDMVITELRRAYPVGVSKGSLESRTGVGPGVLRDVVQELFADGVITDTTVEGGADGFRYLEVNERAVGPAAAAEDMEEGDPPSADLSAPERGPAASETGDPQDVARYQAVFSLEVFFFPEPHDDETADDAAAREARMMLGVVTDAIATCGSDLNVEGGVEAFAYDQPRRVL